MGGASEKKAAIQFSPLPQPLPFPPPPTCGLHLPQPVGTDLALPVSGDGALGSVRLESERVCLGDLVGCGKESILEAVCPVVFTTMTVSFSWRDRWAHTRLLWAQPG